MNRLPRRSVMLKALLDRDPAFEGLFFAGVSSTQVFCRPTCGARKPKPENVRFFPTASDAMHAGFRPCRICRPLERERRPHPMVRRLLAAADRHPESRIADKDLAAMGIDPSTARRRFHAAYGMTFQAYQRARRVGMALRDISRGRRVKDVHRARGFATSGGFRKAFARVFGQPPKQASPSGVLLARRIDTPLGAMLALANDDGIHMLEFVDRRGLERGILALRRRTRAVVVPGSHAHLHDAKRQLAEYFRGDRRDLDLPLALHGSAFQRAVWEALRRIPPGETRSYAELARMVGRPAAVRAVGRANGSNPLALVVPCHRVIGSDGKLTGYGGGVWRKQWLLEHERRARGTSARPSSARASAHAVA